MVPIIKSILISDYELFDEIVFSSQVLQHIGAKQLTSHLRSFCDMLVCEFSKSGQAGHVNKCIDAMNNLIWKYNIIALEKLILCMALRTHEGSEAQVRAIQQEIVIIMIIPISLRQSSNINKSYFYFRCVFSSYNFYFLNQKTSDVEL